MGEARRKKLAGYVPPPKQPKKKRLTNREIERIAHDLARTMIPPY